MVQGWFCPQLDGGEGQAISNKLEDIIILFYCFVYLEAFFLDRVLLLYLTTCMIVERSECKIHFASETQIVPVLTA